jgi:large subunit ribosomal protein L3
MVRPLSVLIGASQSGESRRQMNSNPGVVGRKVGMTQIIDADGNVIPCTVVRSEATIVNKRTQEKDGYDALVLGLEERKEKHTSKPLAGFYKKAGVSAKRELVELRCSAEHAAAFEVGSVLNPEAVLSEGQFVDVQSTSKGKGFAGVMKRHNFKGAPGAHGTHEYFRHGGSIGMNMTPGRTFKGKRMPGHMGDATVSVLNQKVVKIIPEDRLVLVRGGIPGGKNALVVIRGAIKKQNAGKPA